MAVPTVRHGTRFISPLGFLDTKRHRCEGSFFYSQRTAQVTRAGSAEVADRSAVGAETSAPAFLVDALPFGLFLGG